MRKQLPADSCRICRLVGGIRGSSVQYRRPGIAPLRRAERRTHTAISGIKGRRLHSQELLPAGIGALRMADVAPFFPGLPRAGCRPSRNRLASAQGVRGRERVLAGSGLGPGCEGVRLHRHPVAPGVQTTHTAFPRRRRPVGPACGPRRHWGGPSSDAASSRSRGAGAAVRAGVGGRGPGPGAAPGARRRRRGPCRPPRHEVPAGHDRSQSAKRPRQSACQRDSAGRFWIMSSAAHWIRFASTLLVTSLSGHRM